MDRSDTTVIGGRLVNLFYPTWPGRTWLRHLRHERHGFDRPHVFWGRVIVPSSGRASPSHSASTRPLYLRVGSAGNPRSHVRLIAPDVQYVSHVVNLAVPGFGDPRATGGTYDLDLAAVSNQFYRHFADRYDSIAFVAQRSQVADYAAFHRNVKNRQATAGSIADVRQWGSSPVSRVLLAGTVRHHRTVEP